MLIKMYLFVYWISRYFHLLLCTFTSGTHAPRICLDLKLCVHYVFTHCPYVGICKESISAL